MRKALEDLIFVGKIEETFDLYGKSWTMTTLSSREQVEATAATEGYDNLSRINALKIEILARSIKKIQNVELNDVRETLEFISKLQMPVINALFVKYEELQKKQEEALKDIEELKN